MYLLLTEAIEWAKQVLNQTELNVAVVAETPWSNVIKISTLDGLVYLKQTSPKLFIEVAVIQKCRELCKITYIPEVIAANKNLYCFLMKECGNESLRTVFDGNLNVKLLVQGLQIYKNMQQATAAQLDVFIKSGVPDWRLVQFPKLYQDLVSNEEFLQTYELTAAQIKILQGAVKILKILCKELSNYKISECLNHSDFHDNNIMYTKNNNAITIIDLGETAINHPFFSLMACLVTVKNRYKLIDDSEEYKILEKYAFNAWLDDQGSIIRVIEIIKILLPVYLLFTQKRFLDAVDLPRNVNNPLSIKQHDKIKNGFIWFINNIIEAKLI